MSMTVVVDPARDILSVASEIFAAQPFTRFLGAELSSVTRDGVEISLQVADCHKQQHGFVHGGVLSYLADNALTFAGGIALGGDALTAEFKINYVRPATGHSLVARANARAAGKRQAVCQCEIYAIDGAEERLCAVAQGTIVRSG